MGPVSPKKEEGGTRFVEIRRLIRGYWTIGSYLWCKVQACFMASPPTFNKKDIMTIFLVYILLFMFIFFW